MDIIDTLEQAITAIHDYFSNNDSVSSEHLRLSSHLLASLNNYIHHHQDTLSVADLHQLIDAVQSHGAEAPNVWNKLAGAADKVTSEDVRRGHNAAKAALKFAEYGGYPDKASYDAAWRQFEESTGHTTD